MTLHNCKQCGQLFLKQRTEYCGHCRELHDGYYRKVRDFVRTHPRSTILDIHQNTGIPIATLLDLQKDHYIPFAK